MFAKLSRIVKGAAVLQLCLYADQVRRLQGTAPERIAVVTGDGRLHHYRLDDYDAYFRRVRRRFEERLLSAERVSTYPEPVEHCRVCRWWQECADRRRDDDHLSRVAGLTRLQTGRLRVAGVPTLTALGTRPPGGAAVSGISPAALETLRAQAALQLEQYRDGAIRFELIPLSAVGEGRGLASLPLPSPGDVFLDLEADIFVGEGGLEYLFGLLLVEDGRPVYREVWAHSLEDEKAAFCSFLDLVAERRRRWPEMHVYHYGGYESGALKRLMGRHAVREDDLDVLLRGRVLVDLYSVLRQGVRVSDESYSLKKIENSKETKARPVVTRFKGLGEMNPSQLRETTMDPRTRRLVQLTIAAKDDSDQLMDMLLAKKRASDRKDWLEEKGNLAEVIP